MNSMPASLESEKIVLGAVMKAPCVDELTDLTEAHFFHPSHAVIWKTILALNAKGSSTATASVAQRMSEDKTMEDIGGFNTLIEITDFCPTHLIAKEHAEILKDKATKRAVIHAAEQILVEAKRLGNQPVEELMAEVESIWADIKGKRHLPKHSMTLKDLANPIIDSLEYAVRNKGELLGITSGFKKLDEVFNGFRGGQLVILAARPSIGKSALATNMAVSALKAGHKPVLFTLEMPALEVGRRILLGEARMPLEIIRTGIAERGAMNKIMQSTGILSDSIIISEKENVSIADLRSQARIYKKQGKLDILFIDYLQLMKGTTKRSEQNRHLEIAEITGGLKELAKELNIPVIALSQLNREIEKRKGGKPMLSDLRESGAIEQDADIVMLLHRKKEKASEDAEILVAKNRSGVANEVKTLWFDGPTTTFSDYER
jgi:replicative DNA helicase